MSLKKIKKDLIELGKFGRTSDKKRIERYKDLDPEEGITRPSGTEADKKARDYVVEKMEEAGLEVKIDKVGNIFGKLEGSDPNKKSVMIGSHIDTVLNGGMFDGTLGVIGGLEGVRRLNQEGFKNERPIEVVVFTGEEGSAFPIALLGSSVLVGEVSVNEALKFENGEGKTLEKALEEIGYKGNYEKDLSDVEYFIETHVEQGPVLENKNISIGVVENITGISWITASVKGEENHAGTTPMSMRKDALIAAIDIVKFVNNRANEIVKEKNSSTVGTVGKLEVSPGAPNIVPGEVEMGIDIRDVEKENMKSLVNETKRRLNELEEEYGVEVKTEIPLKHLGSHLTPEVSDTVMGAANELGIEAMRMDSGAGHDTQNIAEEVKTGMIFVPSVDGISHTPMEWTEWKDIKKGVKVITNTLKKLSTK